MTTPTYWAMGSLHMHITGLVQQVMVASKHNITALYCTTTYTAWQQLVHTEYIPQGLPLPYYQNDS